MAWIYRRPGSKCWMLGFRVNGKLVQRSTKTEDENEAKGQLAAVEALQGAHARRLPLDHLYAALKGETGPPVSLQVEAHSWLAEVKRTCSEGTHVSYKTTLGQLLEFVGADEKKPLLCDVSTATLRAFQDDLLKRLASSSANQRLDVLKAFFGRAVEEHRLATNPATSLKPVRISAHERKVRRPFTMEEVALLLDKADPFWRYAITAGLYTGLRLGDICTLPVGAVDLAEGVIRLSTQKTSTRLTLPIAKPLRKLLEPRLKGRKPTDDVWPEQAQRYRAEGASKLSEQFKTLLIQCGLVIPTPAEGNGRRRTSEISFHSLRHSFVSLLKSSGSTQAVAKSLAGHSDDAMSDHYTSLPMSTLRDAIAALPEVSA